MNKYQAECLKRYIDSKIEIEHLKRDYPTMIVETSPHPHWEEFIKSLNQPETGQKEQGNPAPQHKTDPRKWDERKRMETQTPIIEKSPEALIAEIVNIEEARKLYGDPEYGYFKENVYPRGRGRNVEHFSTGKVEITKEEYDANKAESKRLESKRFMGEKVGCFTRYTIKLKRDGWPQHLKRQIESVERDIIYNS